MESKTIVITSIISILLITIVASIIGWNTRDYDSNFSDQECKRSGKYCVFNEIPAGMMYSKTSESIYGVHEFEGNLEDYVYNIHESQNDYPNEYPEQPQGDGEVLVAKRMPTPMYEINIWDISSYKCKSTDEKPEVIEYFSSFCGGSSRIGGGCGHGRRALVCGDGYLIQDTEEYQTKTYGPYDMPNLID